MRPLEIIMLILTGIGYIRHLLPSLRKLLPRLLFETLSLGILAAHFTFEGYRWQLLPGYLLLLLLLITYWLLPAQSQRSYKRAWLSSLISLGLGLIFLSSILLPALLPVPQLSAPSGPYAVGTRTWHWVDESRIDPYAPEDGKPREIIIQTWYPILHEDQGEPSPWMAAAEIVAPAVAQWIELPSFFLDHLVHVETYASIDAPIASHQGSFPVLLFSHGYGGFRAQNTNQMQHLASNGFVILAPDHTYGSVVTVFPDGRTAAHNPDTLPDNLPPEKDLRATRALGDQWASDLSFILDQLTQEQGSQLDPEWRAALDLDRIGAFGHSTGGGAVIEFCYRDSRCKATLTLDPFLKPVSAEALENGLEHFAVHMFSETWSSKENLERFAPIVQNSDSMPLVVSVRGSAHYDFSDLPLLTPLAHAIGLKGPINGSRMAAIVNDHLLAYFRQSLQGASSSLLQAVSSEYPEVIDQQQIGRP